MKDIFIALLLGVTCVESFHTYTEFDEDGHQRDDDGEYPKGGHYPKESSATKRDKYNNYPDSHGQYSDFGSFYDVDPCTNGLNKYNAYGIYHGDGKRNLRNSYHGLAAGLPGYRTSSQKDCCCDPNYISFVCGNDGITYMNECILRCHRKFNSRLDVCKRTHCFETEARSCRAINPYYPWEYYSD